MQSVDYTFDDKPVQAGPISANMIDSLCRHRIASDADAHDIEVAGTVGAVSRSEHPLVRDEGAAAEPGVINEQGDLGHKSQIR